MPKRKTLPFIQGNTLTLTTVIVLAAAAGCQEHAWDEAGLLDTFEKIHRRIYDVYDLRDPYRVFDLLAGSCKGKELEKQVFEYLKCLKVQEEFNTAVTIADVLYNDVRVVAVEEDVAQVYCKWVVIGKVRHPTHIHRKTNLNEAYYWVHLGEEGPRITGYDQITNQALEVTNR